MAHSFGPRGRTDPMIEPKGTLRQPQRMRDRQPVDPGPDATRFDIPEVPAKPSRSRYSSKSFPALPTSQRKMSRGSTIAAWVLAFIVVLFALNMLQQEFHLSTTNPTPSPTTTITVTPSPSGSH